MIALDVIGKDKLAIRVIKGTENFERDRDLIRTLPGRAPIYKIDPTTQTDKFQYFEVPRTLLSNILTYWEEEEIIPTPPAKALLDKFKKASAHIGTGESIEGDLGVLRTPKTYQDSYIRLNRDKNKTLVAFEQQCIGGDEVLSIIRAKKGFKISMRDLYHKFNGGQTGRGKRTWDLSFPTYGKSLCGNYYKPNIIKEVIFKGVQPVFRLTLDSGKTLVLTSNHEVAQPEGSWTPLSSLKVGDEVLTNGIVICKGCGKEKSVQPKNERYQKYPGWCRSCIATKFRPKPSGGQYVTSHGYVAVTGQWEHPKGSKRGQIYEHVLVMEAYLGRYLEKGEIVHHKNEIKTDNRIENLALLTQAEHLAEHNNWLKLDGKTNRHGQEIIYIPRIDRVKSIEPAGELDVYDLVMDDPYRNFVVNGVLVHNCGKTFAAVARSQVLGSSRTLVVTPNCTRPNWKVEIMKTIGDDSSIIYKGTPKQREKLKAKLGDYKWIISSYQMSKELADIKFDQIIVDEAHLVAHPATDRFKYVQRIVKNNPEAGVQLCSGTPILHKPSDLWALVYLISPELAGSKKLWDERYEEVLATKTIWKNGRSIKIPIRTRTRNLDELHEKLKSIMVRVKRDEFVTFEDRIEITTTELDSTQKTYYENAVNSLLLEVGESSLPLNNILTKMLRLQQISEGLFHFIEKSPSSSKLEYVENAIESGEKIIVWSQFKKLPEILVGKYKDKAVLFTSDVSDNYKQLAKWAFQGCSDAYELSLFNDLLKKVKDFPFGPGEAQIFTGTISYLSSLGMTLDKCNRQIFTSLNYQPTSIFQASDRIKSINQAAEVVYTEFLLTENTIDQKTLELILTNYKNINHVLDGRDSLSYNQTKTLLADLRRLYVA